MRRLTLILASAGLLAGGGLAVEASAAMAAKCHCKRGPRGFRGPAGRTGPAGPPGPAGSGGGGGGGGGSTGVARVYSALAPGTTATTVDTNGNGILSVSCSGGSALTVNFITNGDVVAELQGDLADVGSTVKALGSDDPEGTVTLIPSGGVGDGLLTVAVTGGTADGGSGLQVTYNFSAESGGDTPDAPASGCLVGGTKVTA